VVGLAYGRQGFNKGVSYMKAFRFYGQRDGKIEDVVKPVAGEGELLLKVTQAGICQTQISEFIEGPYIINKDPHPITGRCLPLIPGHEFGGIVESVGPGADESWIGINAALMPARVCGKCVSCQAGNLALCDVLSYQGLLGEDGGFAEYAVINQSNAFKCERTELLSWVEPILCGIHQGMKIKKYTDASNILVLGCGPLGLSAAAILEKYFGMEVTLLDRLPGRLARAREAGFNAVGRDEIKGQFDVVIDNAGSNHTDTNGGFIEAFDHLKKSGSLVLVGTYFHPVSVVPMAVLVVSERNIIPSFSYDARDVKVLDEVISSLEKVDFKMLNTDIHINDILDEGYYRAEVDKDSFTRLVISRFD